MALYGNLSEMEFEWDVSKELTNFKKHRVAFLEAVETFLDPKAIQLVDESHSACESRYYWVGKTKGGRILTTWFTHRSDKIRIIGSAEWRKFRRVYEQAAQTE